jgi:hypothetical protein
VLFVEPESMTEIPPNCNDWLVLTIILLVDTLNCDEVTYWIDCDVAVNVPVTVKLPPIVPLLVICNDAPLIAPVACIVDGAII